MTKLDISRRAEKQLLSLPKRQKANIAGRLKQLAFDPYPANSKQLKGKLSHYRRLRVGAYRVIYYIEGDVIMVALIETRNDGRIYKEMTRKS